MTNLVIVESPAKAKKIAGFLGEGWRVEACLGHVRDLPENALGVDIEANFQPTYTVLKGKINLVRRLIKGMKAATAIYLATDPDREGEAIAWHLLELAQLPASKPTYRIALNAITASAVKQAFATPRIVDAQLVEAQQARRLVDRLIGYLVSPLAVKALGGKFSAERVQSVCLRFIVEREREIERFQPQPFWTIALKLSAEGEPFTAKLAHIKDVELPFNNLDLVDRVAARISQAQVWVERVGQAYQERQPLPPFTTSTLQRTAAKVLGLSPDRTMALAQMLYEAGLITYMRTDGATVAPEAQEAARIFIERTYGIDYLPPSPPIYKPKALNAQESHEAIRPTDVTDLPNAVEGDGAAFYALIWRRFIASQMQAARYLNRGALIYAGKAIGEPFPIAFHAQARSLIFDGFLKVYEEPTTQDGEAADHEERLPPLRDGQILTSISTETTESQTRPPVRYNDASLIEALEIHGVGRPSTYASMVKLVKEKAYVKTHEKRLVPTPRGVLLYEFLTTHFNDILATDYSARLEVELDRIASGDQTRRELLHQFWSRFQPRLKGATEVALSQWRARHAPKPVTLRPVAEVTHEQPIA